MYGIKRLHPLKLPLEFVVLAVLSTLLFAVLAAVPSGVALIFSVSADVTPFLWGPELTTTVAVFLGVAFGAGLGLTSRLPPIEPLSEESTESADDGNEYAGRYRVWFIDRASTNVRRDLYVLLNLLRVSALVGIGIYFVEAPPTDLSVSAPVLVMTYAFVDEVLYGLDLSVGSLPISSPSGYVYIVSVRLIKYVCENTEVIQIDSNPSFPQDIDSEEFLFVAFQDFLSVVSSPSGEPNA